MLVLFAEAKGALAILTGDRDLWSDACALWVQVGVAASLCPSVAARVCASTWTAHVEGPAWPSCLVLVCRWLRCT